MAKGQEEKQIITAKILETFPNSFVVDKDIRIPINDVEIKISLTCAKDILGKTISADLAAGSDFTTTSSVKVSTEPSRAELEAVAKVLEKLNI